MTITAPLPAGEVGSRHFAVVLAGAQRLRIPRRLAMVAAFVLRYPTVTSTTAVAASPSPAT